MNAPVVRRLSTALLAPSALLAVGAHVLLGLAVGNGGHGAADRAGCVFAFFAPGCAVPGAILARRWPAIPIGWLFLAAALTCALAGFGAAYTRCGAGRRELLPGTASRSGVALPRRTAAMLTSDRRGW